METNPYEYDRPLPWIPQENRFHEARYIPARPGHEPSAKQYQEWQRRVQDHKPRPQVRMPKARALELAGIFKKRLIVASLALFALLSGLVAYHQVGASANQGQVDPSQSAPATQPYDGGFFNQQGGNNFGSSNPWQPPASGSRVS